MFTFSTGIDITLFTHLLSPNSYDRLSLRMFNVFLIYSSRGSSIWHSSQISGIPVSGRGIAQAENCSSYRKSRGTETVMLSQLGVDGPAEVQSILVLILYSITAWAIAIMFKP
jgi:hypothetical protein